MMRRFGGANVSLQFHLAKFNLADAGCEMPYVVPRNADASNLRDERAQATKSSYARRGASAAIFGELSIACHPLVPNGKVWRAIPMKMSTESIQLHYHSRLLANAWPEPDLR